MIHALLLAAAAILVPEASSPQNDYNLSEAGRTRVFARSEAEFRNARIMVSERSRAGWSEPRQIAFSDPRWSDSDPWLTPDGRTLYFISDRPAPGRAEGARDYDIWRAVRTATGAWSAPERLGPEVNSAGQELGPELHGTTLYFSSARRSGLGGLDIYAAPAAGTGFARAALLDGPFNGAASDSDFTLSPDGRTALFWRSGEGGTGLLHIARRTAGGPWSEPAPLPAAINRGPFNFTPSFSRDGRTITYASTGADGLADIYRARLPT
ncbi:MAG TPA: hypothetical protein VF552_01660 [Allosphingosinicella sp.]|jgi:hypothetical protein